MGIDKIDLGNKSAGAIGGGLGSAIGLFGGPVGAIAGGALGSIFGDALKDFAARMLSAREKLRVENSSTYIVQGIIDRWKDGAIVRQDGFFEGGNNFTSDGKELLEGILLKCKDQYQERKVPFISNIFKNVAFNEHISARAAYQTLTLADSLTYQNLCMLSFYGQRENFTDFNILNRAFFHFPEVTFSTDTKIAGQDLFDMHHQGIVQIRALANNSTFVEPGRIEITARGQMAYDLMELNLLPREDILEALKPLEFQTRLCGHLAHPIEGSEQMSHG